jgi:hypothetical protein
MEVHSNRVKSTNAPFFNGLICRQVPAMPLAYYNKHGKVTRYNLRKFTELPFQLVRCYRQVMLEILHKKKSNSAYSNIIFQKTIFAFRYKDLYDHVLFNYQWLYAKMCAVPLPEVLGRCNLEVWIYATGFI